MYRLGVSAGNPEPADHRRVSVPEGEVDHLAALPDRPQQADGLRESVEEPAEPGGPLLAEHLAELRVVSPGLGLELETCVGHQRRIRAVRGGRPVTSEAPAAAGGQEPSTRA